MQTIIGQMLEQYRADSLGEERNAPKEVVQEVALCGLSRAGFFKSAAFYGGTALRIFYGLDRFSEDLDFSLTAPDPSFGLKAYFPILESEIRATGLHFTVEEKVKSAESNIRSAFLKGNTKEHILSLCLLSCKRGGGQSGASEGAAGRFRIDRGRVSAGSGSSDRASQRTFCGHRLRTSQAGRAAVHQG